MDIGGDSSSGSSSGGGRFAFGERVERDDSLVPSVMAFWFGIGGGSPDAGAGQDHLRKSKWFVRQGPARDALYADIKSRFLNALQALEKQFTTDEESSALLKWLATPHSALSAVIVLDQFSRHIYRGDRARVTACTQIAQKISRVAILKEYDRMMPLAQACFLYMPIRHANQWFEDKLSLFKAPELRNLRRRCDALQRESAEHAKTMERFDEATRSSISKGLANGAKENNTFSDDDILERRAFDPKDALVVKVPSNALYRALVAFLRPRISFDKSSPASVPVIVSLSGGVDSMVIAKLLWYASKRTHLIPIVGHLDIYAVHIDYGNRPESAAEAAFLRSWCSQHGIDLRVKRINEVRRGITARDDYEKVARKIRFAEYKTLLAELSTKNVGVMFAHHRGDVQENVISNVMRGAGITSLSGMGADTLNDGVRIWRPLLEFGKDAVYAFAHAYGVPYFKDTTPSWSTRGKLRNRLLPCLENVYGSGYPQQLTALAQQSDDMDKLVRDRLIDRL